MSKDRIVKVGLALVFAAAGFYLEYGPRALGTMAESVAGGGQVMKLWREP